MKGRICSPLPRSGGALGRGVHLIEFNAASTLSPPVLIGIGAAAGGKLKAMDSV